MRTPKKFPLFLGILIVFLIIIPFINLPKANGVSYYNWLQNYSFEGDINLIDDFSFESGIFNSGTEYGNWSGTGVFDTTTRTGVAYSGVYCLDIGGENVWYNLTESVLGADIIEFTFWACNYNGAGSYDIQMSIYYSDFTSDSFEVAVNDMAWVQSDIEAHINDMKYVVAFYLDGEDNFGEWIDSFRLIISDIDGQNHVALWTKPWFNLDIAGALSEFFTFDWGTGSDITTDEYYTGTQSYEFIEGDSVPIGQSLNYIDSDYVHYGDMMIKTEDINGVIMQFYVTYSNGRTSGKNYTVPYNSGNWQHIIFSNFVYTNMYVKGIYLVCIPNSEDSGLSTYIDDVGLWCSVNVDWKRFDWTLSPNPIGYSTGGFTAYQKKSYTLTVNIYNETGQKSESGTYQVTDGSFGIKDGSFSSGTFAVSLNQRESTIVETISDTISVLIFTGSETIEIDLNGSWNYVAVPSGDDIYSNQSDFVALIFMLVVMLCPSMVVAFKCAEKNFDPFLGFLGTFNIMCIIGLVTNLIALWVLVITIIIDVFLGLMVLHQRGTI